MFKQILAQSSYMSRLSLPWIPWVQFLPLALGRGERNWSPKDQGEPEHSAVDCITFKKTIKTRGYLMIAVREMLVRIQSCAAAVKAGTPNIPYVSLRARGASLLS
jgi:hypothetical protein